MISVKNLSWSNHVTEDRESRTLSILMTVGVGEIVSIKQDYGGKRLRAFTDTGCILVLDPMGETVITFFLSSIDQMVEFFNGQVPPEIRKSVKHSLKIYTKYLARG